MSDAPEWVGNSIPAFYGQKIILTDETAFSMLYHPE